MSSVSFSHAVAEWMRTSELEDSTRRTYEGYIARTIGPVLGELPVRKIDARVLETFYAELRRCRTRCNPMAAGTVRQIHAIISGPLDAAVRWTWIDSNPRAHRP